ncbi:hypothetical protein ACH5RR_001736 [Cinchona calisaya]|uniref:F-box associated beta-propeller type 3 domain-containing protein n=1 Tax=Cinchona calisaya TaxID=153742 RepID=A0ABD3B4T3_9GENT
MLYWMIANVAKSSRVPCVESIMSFDIINEEFSIMPHPPQDDGGDQWCKNDPWHSSMDLLTMDGFLSLIQHSSSNESFKINIWILKDHAKRLCMKTHAAVNVQVYVPDFALRWASGSFAVVFVAVFDGEILFRRQI